MENNELEDGLECGVQQYTSIPFNTRAIRLGKNNLNTVLEMTGQKTTAWCSQDFLKKYGYVKFPTPNELRLTTIVRINSWVCLDEFGRIFSMTDYEFQGSFRIVEN